MSALEQFAFEQPLAPPTSSLPWYFDLREKAHKRWHHLETDKFVYVSKILNRQLYAPLFVSEGDLDIRPWIEAHLVLSGKRNVHYCLVVEFPFLEGDSGLYFKEHSGIRSVEREYPMLISVPKEIEPPERVGFVRLPALVWLKRLHDGDCLAGHTSGCGGDLSLCVRAIFSENGKVDFPGTPPAGQIPRQMVERSAEVADKIASKQPELNDLDLASGFAFDVEKPPFSILLNRYRINLFGITDKAGEMSIKSVQVNLRPLHLEVAMLDYHDWPLLSEMNRSMISA